MTKKLKIRFAKFERALVAQQLEIEGIHHFVENMHTQFSPFYLELRRDGVCIAVKENNVFIKHRIFNDNSERDKYLENVIKWISEEQFAMGGTLRIGEPCKFSDDGEKWYFGKYAGKCAEQLGEPRFLSGFREATSLTRWKYARANGGRLKIDGDVYEWEMEVAE